MYVIAANFYICWDSYWFQVEGWLNRILDRMRSSLRNNMSEAVVAYEEKPRDQWLFDYPAQVSLCGTQIWWTTEVNMAFERLEEVCYGLHLIIYSVWINWLSWQTKIIDFFLFIGIRQRIEGLHSKTTQHFYFFRHCFSKYVNVWGRKTVKIVFLLCANGNRENGLLFAYFYPTFFSYVFYTLPENFLFLLIFCSMKQSWAKQSQAFR